MNQQSAPKTSLAPGASDGFTQANGLPALPIVIGVVGHRDIRPSDREALKATLKEVFRQFQDAYPHTPLVVISALAEGADQLAAQAALESGAFVRAPLPFAPEIYRLSTSFDVQDGRDELDALLANERVEWFVAPLPNGLADQGTDWLRVATDRTDPACKELRYTCYANAGGYIARRCNVLIALQDALEYGRSRGPSGTAEYVDFKLKGRPPSRYPWKFAEPLGYRNERRLVMTIDTPRACPARGAAESPDDRPTERSVGTPRVLVPGERDEPWPLPQEWLPLARRIGDWSRFWARVAASLGFLSVTDEWGTPAQQQHRRMKAELRQFRETCTNVDDFNRDLTLPAVDAAIRRRVANPDKLRATHFDEEHNDWMLRLSRIREAAAALSGHLQPQLDNALLAVLALLGLSVLFFHLYAHLFQYDEVLHHPEHSPSFLVAFLILLVAAGAVVAVAWWRRLDERRLDARSLAEGLRVRRAWALAGLNRSVADSYSGQIRSEMSWIRQSLLQISPPPQVWFEQFHRFSRDQQLELLNQIRKEWVQGQKEQHEKGHKKQHDAATNLRRWGFGLAVAGWLILARLLFASDSSSTTVHIPDHSVPKSTAAKAAAEQTNHPATEAEPIATAHAPLSPRYPRDWTLILASSLVIAGGLCIAHCERRSYEELSKQYERMAILFANGDRELADRLDAGDVVGAQNVISALGQEAIIEHAQWLILRRARQLELHIGG